MATTKKPTAPSGVNAYIAAAAADMAETLPLLRDIVRKTAPRQNSSR